jgi:pectinesterase
MREWIVAGDGSGDFSTIGEALAAARIRLEGGAGKGGTGKDGVGARIVVRAGLYREKLKVTVPGIELAGEGQEATRIVWDDCASRLLPSGERMGTFNSSTLYVGAPRTTLRDLAIVNDSGDGRLVGQAVALYADADLLLVEGCRISARQDTLCTGPLPKNPAPKGVNLIHPVAGLGEDVPALPFRQLYRSCRIEGDVDFIFGSAMALFEDCEIRSLARPLLAQLPLAAIPNPDGCPEGTPPGPAQGWIAAPSTYPGQATGFVFAHCELSAEEGTQSVYLGRPWRPTGRAVLVDCWMGAHIAPEGWDDWGKPEARAFGGFAEFGSRGPGAPPPSGSGRVSWAKTQPEAEAVPGESPGAEPYSAQSLFGSAFAGR